MRMQMNAIPPLKAIFITMRWDSMIEKKTSNCSPRRGFLKIANSYDFRTVCLIKIGQFLTIFAKTKLRLLVIHGKM